jgi:hypothetical protein
MEQISTHNVKLNGISSRTRRRCRGAMLVDALIATFFSTSILIACISLSMSASAAANAARQNDLAYGAARQVVENIRHAGAAQIQSASYPDATIFGPVPQINQDAKAGGTLGPGSLVRAVVQNRAGSQAKLLIVTVEWPARRASATITKSKTLTTFIAPNGFMQ